MTKRVLIAVLVLSGALAAMCGQLPAAAHTWRGVHRGRAGVSAAVPALFIFKVPLTEFITEPEFPKTRLAKLYVLLEIVFESDTPVETVYFRNVRFER